MIDSRYETFQSAQSAKKYWLAFINVMTPRKLGPPPPEEVARRFGAAATDWYARVVDVPLATLDIADLVALLERRILEREVMLAALDVLSIDPLVSVPGHPPGQLLAHVVRVSRESADDAWRKGDWQDSIQSLVDTARFTARANNVPRTDGYWLMIDAVRDSQIVDYPSNDKPDRAEHAAILGFFGAWVPSILGIQYLAHEVPLFAQFLLAAAPAGFCAFAMFRVACWRERQLAYRAMAAVRPALPLTSPDPSPAPPIVDVEPPSTKSLRDLGAPHPDDFEEHERCNGKQRHDCDWYRDAFERPLATLSTDQLVLLCSHLFYESAVATALNRLQFNPLASSAGAPPGELLTKVLAVRGEYWDTKPRQLAALRMIVWRARETARKDHPSRYIQVIERWKQPIRLRPSSRPMPPDCFVPRTNEEPDSFARGIGFVTALGFAIARWALCFGKSPHWFSSRTSFPWEHAVTDVALVAGLLIAFAVEWLVRKRRPQKQT